MRFVITVGLIFIILVTGSCGREHHDLPVGFKYNPPETPTNLQVEPGMGKATLTWSYPEQLLEGVEFKVYYYSEIYNMIELVATTADTIFVDSTLIGNMEYCYKVSAVDSTGLEGYRTDHVCEIINTNQ